MGIALPYRSPILVFRNRTCRGVGGTFPAPAFPLGETGKGDQIPRCRRQFDVAPTVCTPLLSYVLFCPSSLPITVTNIFVLSILSPSRSAFQIFQKSRRRTHCVPCFYPHSEWAAMGPVQVGIRSKAQVHHHVTDLGCWVLPSTWRSLKDQYVTRSHPNKAVDVVPAKTFRYLLACEWSTHVCSLRLTIRERSL
jgi:hypothetical protein